MFINMNIYSVPAYPHPITITQPDGSQLTIRLHGDEFHKARTTLDGYLISINEAGFYTYSVQDENLFLKPSSIIARNIDERSSSDINHLQKALKLENLTKEQKSGKASKIKKAPQAIQSTGFPLTGSPRSLVILVNFQDKSFVTSNPIDAFTRLLNQENYSDNGGTGSARDYFRASSYGLFNPQFDVVGPYTLPQNMSYYGANDSYGDDKKPTDMIVDACALAYANGIDFSIYDTDNDGYVDNVFVYYAGYNEAEGASTNTIWPHRWVVYPGENYDGSWASITFNDVTVYDYACTSELKGKTGANMCGIGTFCHEFGHVLGLPDYYHTEDNKATLDFWSIMDAGSYSNDGKTPPTYSAYDRFFLGWLTPEELKTSEAKELKPISQSKVSGQNTEKQSYLLSQITHNLIGDNPSPNEFFIMEYRKKTGWDAYLPAEGLLFWHIDYDDYAWEDNSANNYSGSKQTASSHMRVYLQPLSGSTNTPGTAFTSGSFTPTTWSGTDINRKITNISKMSEKVTFNIEVTTQGGTTTPTILAAVVYETLQFNKIGIGEQQAKYLKISSDDITNDLTLNLSGDDADLFTLSNNSITKDDVIRQQGAEIHIIFKPLAEGNFTADLTISGGGMLDPKVIQLQAAAK